MIHKPQALVLPAEAGGCKGFWACGCCLWCCTRSWLAHYYYLPECTVSCCPCRILTLGWAGNSDHLELTVTLLSAASSSCKTYFELERLYLCPECFLHCIYTCWILGKIETKVEKMQFFAILLALSFRACWQKIRLNKAEFGPLQRCRKWTWCTVVARLHYIPINYVSGLARSWSQGLSIWGLKFGVENLGSLVT